MKRLPRLKNSARSGGVVSANNHFAHWLLTDERFGAYRYASDETRLQMQGLVRALSLGRIESTEEDRSRDSANHHMREIRRVVSETRYGFRSAVDFHALNAAGLAAHCCTLFCYAGLASDWVKGDLERAKRAMVLANSMWVFFEDFAVQVSQVAHIPFANKRAWEEVDKFSLELEKIQCEKFNGMFRRGNEHQVVQS